MKTILSAAVLLLFGLTASANTIDKLKTAHDVNQFLRNVLPKTVNLSIDETAIVKSKYGKNRFYKLDLDGNGLTDLVVDGTQLVAVTNTAGENYAVHGFDTYSVNYSVVNILASGRVPILVIRRYDAEAKTTGGKDTEKTVLMKFGEFIEYNRNPDSFKIEKIAFKQGGCYGDCPIFDIDIRADRSAFYNAIRYNKQNEGLYTGTIDAASYKRLIQTINYMGLANLKNEYTVPWTDDATAYLKVTFDNGKIKEISDYGPAGTFGLANLFHQLFELRDNQNWTKLPRIQT